MAGRVPHGRVRQSYHHSCTGSRSRSHRCVDAMQRTAVPGVLISSMRQQICVRRSRLVRVHVVRPNLESSPLNLGTPAGSTRELTARPKFFDSIDEPPVSALRPY